MTTSTNPSKDQVRIAQTEIEVTIDAPIQAVWQGLTEDIAAWWPSAFYCHAGDPAAVPVRKFKLEARPGGRMWEDWGNDNGMVWANVVQVAQPRLLDITGTMGMAWGGPSTMYASFQLEATDTGTKLRFSEAAYGRIPDSQGEEQEKGWRFLLGEALRAHCEGKPAPEWKD